MIWKIVDMFIDNVFICFPTEHVAPFKQLRGGVEFRKEIPKSASGKILRRILKDEYTEGNLQN